MLDTKYVVVIAILRGHGVGHHRAKISPLFMWNHSSSPPERPVAVSSSRQLARTTRGVAEVQRLSETGWCNNGWKGQ